MTSLVLIVAVGAAVAGFVQGLAGFAFGLVAMALWAWTLEPALAGPLVVFGSLVGQLIAARAVMRDLGRTHAWPFVIGGVAGVPLGVMLLHYINPLAFKAAVGLLLVVWCPLMMRAATLPRLRWGGIWADAGAGWVGGVMGGLGGLTGPAPVLWTTLRGWDRGRQRVTLVVFNLAMHSLTMTAYLLSGTVPRAALPLFGVVLPAMIIPTYVGFRLYDRISDTAFRRVLLSLLTLSGMVLLLTSAAKLI